MSTITDTILVGDTRDDRLRREALDTLRLDGDDLTAKVGDNVKDVTVTRTIEGASTVVIALVDEDWDLLASGLFHQEDDKGRIQLRPVTVELLGRHVDADPLRFELVQLSTPGPNLLTLTFEDFEVAEMRRYTKPRKGDRRKMTRAEFIRMLVREADPPIRFWSPELAKKQPVGKVKLPKSKSKANEQRTNGFPDHPHITVKHVRASAAQVRVLEQVLQTGAAMGATKTVLIGAVMCVTQESTAQNLAGGDRDSRGAFQQRKSQGWPATRDVPKDARAFFTRMIAASSRYAGTGKSLGWVVDTVQRSGTYGTSRQGSSYQQWREEATITVNVWAGEDGYTASSGGSTVKINRYYFRRGEPGQGKENTWTAAKRLCDEVAWRCFMDRGLMHVASDFYLLHSKPRYVIRRGDLPDGVDSVALTDLDVGKALGEFTLNVWADSWNVPVGAVVKVEDYGVADGRYLIAEDTGSLFSSKRSVRCVKPTPPKGEPAPTTTTASAGGSGGSTAHGSGSMHEFMQWARSTKGTHEGTALQRRWAADLGYSASLPWCSIWIGFGIKHHTSLPLPGNPAYSGAWLNWSGGRRVSQSKMERGDFLVFDWGDGGRTDHVGVYLGDGRYISGNFSNQVSVGPVNRSAIVGVVRPRW